jgi:hypothetical protein
MILAGFLLAFSLVGTNFNKLDSGDVNPLHVKMQITPINASM